MFYIMLMIKKTLLTTTPFIGKYLMFQKSQYYLLLAMVQTLISDSTVVEHASAELPIRVQSMVLHGYVPTSVVETGQMVPRLPKKRERVRVLPVCQVWWGLLLKNKVKGMFLPLIKFFFPYLVWQSLFEPKHLLKDILCYSTPESRLGSAFGFYLVNNVSTDQRFTD